MVTASSRRVRSLALTIGLFSTGVSCVVAAFFWLDVMAFLTGKIYIIVTAGG